jgi:arsenate reductase
MLAQVYNVLFLGTGNSARSIMAEAVLNRASRRFRAFSAGSHPNGTVHPFAIDLLRKLNFDVSELRSKSWLEFGGAEAPRLDFVFAVYDKAAAEASPPWRGEPMTARWEVPDPAEAQGNEAELRLAFADAFRMLSNRINIFVNLPARSFGQLTLQKRLDAIGKTDDADTVLSAAAEPARMRKRRVGST